MRSCLPLSDAISCARSLRGVGCRKIGAHQRCSPLLQALFMIASALPATAMIATTVRTINKGVFIATSLPRAPKAYWSASYPGLNERAPDESNYPNREVRPRSLGRTMHAPEASSSSKISSPFLMRGQMSAGKFAIKLSVGVCGCRVGKGKAYLRLRSSFPGS
jgi:hypothetical protein